MQDGWLVLDKPLGITSAHAVSVVKRILKPSKIGHGGTLDPLASGILPLALGEATKTFDYIANHQKEYTFTVCWGEARDTDDAEGIIIKQSSFRPYEAAITRILPSFTGKILQKPPIFSAISNGGERAYKQARAGKEFELAAREVTIDALYYLGSPNQNFANFHVVCGKGTYIRSLARDFGEKLGCYGYVAALRRTRVGKFTEQNAISLDALKNMDYEQQSKLQLTAIDDVLDDILAITLPTEQALRLRQGQSLEPVFGMPSSLLEGNIMRCYQEEGRRLFAFAKLQAGKIKPVRVFNYNDKE